MMKKIKQKISLLLLMVVLFTYTTPIFSIDKKRHSIGISTSQTTVGKNNLFIFPEKYTDIDQFGINYNYYFNNSFSLGLEYNTFIEKEIKDIKWKDLEWEAFNVNLILNYYLNNGYVFSNKSVITPYFALGLAYYRIDVNNKYKDYSSFSNSTFSELGRVGLNLQWNKYISTQLYLQRARVLPIYNMDKKEFISQKNNSLHTIGLTFKFHFKSEEKREFKSPLIYTSGTIEEYQKIYGNKSDTTLVSDSLNTTTDTISEVPLLDSNLLIPIEEDVEVETNKEKSVKKEKAPRKIKIYQKEGKLNIYIDKGRALDIEIENNLSNKVQIVKDTTILMKNNRYIQQDSTNYVNVNSLKKKR